MNKDVCVHIQSPSLVCVRANGDVVSFLILNIPMPSS